MCNFENNCPALSQSELSNFLFYLLLSEQTKFKVETVLFVFIDDEFDEDYTSSGTFCSYTSKNLN